MAGVAAATAGRRNALRLGHDLFLTAAGAGDGRDVEIAIGNHRPHIGRKLDMADVDRAADLPAGEVDLDLLRDVVGRAVKLDLVAHDVENAAALEPGRCLVIGEMDGHGHRDALAGAEPQEVDMDDAVADHVELDVAGNGADLVAAELDIDQGGEKPAGLDRLPQLVVRQRHQLRLFLAAIDDTRNQAVATGRPGSSLAAGLARRCLQ